MSQNLIKDMYEECIYFTRLNERERKLYKQWGTPQSLRNEAAQAKGMCEREREREPESQQEQEEEDGNGETRDRRKKKRRNELARAMVDGCGWMWVRGK